MSGDVTAARGTSHTATRSGGINHAIDNKWPCRIAITTFPIVHLNFPANLTRRSVQNNNFRVSSCKDHSVLIQGYGVALAVSLAVVVAAFKRRKLMSVLPQEVSGLRIQRLNIVTVPA